MFHVYYSEVTKETFTFSYNENPYARVHTSVLGAKGTLSIGRSELIHYLTTNEFKRIKITDESPWE